MIVLFFNNNKKKHGSWRIWTDITWTLSLNNTNIFKCIFIYANIDKDWQKRSFQKNPYIHTYMDKDQIRWTHYRMKKYYKMIITQELIWNFENMILG